MSYIDHNSLFPDHPIFFLRMYLALRAYHELMCILNDMDRSKDPALRENARVIKGEILGLLQLFIPQIAKTLNII